MDGRFDLVLDNVSLDAALDAVERLDATFQVGTHQDVLMIWPSSKEDIAASPFSRELPPLQVEGGAGDVLRQVLVAAGLADTTDLIVKREGLRRPVSLDLHGVTVRDAFAEVARQAHLTFLIEPGSVNVNAAKQ